MVVIADEAHDFRQDLFCRCRVPAVGLTDKKINKKREKKISSSPSSLLILALARRLVVVGRARRGTKVVEEGGKKMGVVWFVRRFFRALRAPLRRPLEPMLWVAAMISAKDVWVSVCVFFFPLFFFPPMMRARA